MNGFTELKDIRFSDTKANILLRGGMISREHLMNVKDSMINMSNVHFGIAKRINDVTSLEVKHMDEWRSVMCGDTTTLQNIYASAVSEDETDSHEGYVVVETAPDEESEEDIVEVLRDFINNPVNLGPSIIGDSVPNVEVKDEEPVEDAEEIEDHTHRVRLDWDRPDDEPKAIDESTEDSQTGHASKVNEVFVTGMSVADSIEDLGISTVTDVTTISTEVTTVASDSTDTAEVAAEPAFDVSNVEPASTSTSTAFTTINSQGNARRQVNINAHGKHRRR